MAFLANQKVNKRVIAASVAAGMSCLPAAHAASEPRAAGDYYEVATLGAPAVTYSSCGWVCPSHQMISEAGVPAAATVVGAAVNNWFLSAGNAKIESVSAPFVYSPTPGQGVASIQITADRKAGQLNRGVDYLLTLKKSDGSVVAAFGGAFTADGKNYPVTLNVDPGKMVAGQSYSLVASAAVRTEANENINVRLGSPVISVTATPKPVPPALPGKPESIKATLKDSTLSISSVCPKSSKVNCIVNAQATVLGKALKAPYRAISPGSRRSVRIALSAKQVKALKASKKVAVKVTNSNSAGQGATVSKKVAVKVAG